MKAGPWLESRRVGERRAERGWGSSLIAQVCPPEAYRSVHTHRNSWSSHRSFQCYPSRRAGGMHPRFTVMYLAEGVPGSPLCQTSPAQPRVTPAPRLPSHGRRCDIDSLLSAPIWARAARQEPASGEEERPHSMQRPGASHEITLGQEGPAVQSYETGHRSLTLLQTPLPGLPSTPANGGARGLRWNATLISPAVTQ